MHTNNNDFPKKPFPWRCSNCREKTVYEAVVDYVTTRHHDGRSYTIEIRGLKTPKCTHCGQAAPDAEALTAITRALLTQAKLLTPAEIHASRIKAKLTQDQLAAAAGVAVEAVARLEDGVQIQSRTLDNMLRLVFGMPQGREVLTTHQADTLAPST